MIGFARLFAVVVALMMIAFGVWLATYGNEDEIGLVFLGIFVALLGVGGIGALLFERMRYSSQAAEAPPNPGPPGGDDPGEPLEARFAPTSEIFVDPTSGKTMRVFADPATGERRYRVED